MKDIFCVFSFTFGTGIKKKSFIVSTLIIVTAIIIGAALLGAFNIPERTEHPDDGSQITLTPDSRPRRCDIFDTSGIFTDISDKLNSEFTDIGFFAASGNSDEAIEDCAADRNRIIIVTSPPSEPDGPPVITFYCRSVLFSVFPYSDILNVFDDFYIAHELELREVDNRDILVALSELSYDIRYVGGMNFTGYIAGLLLTTLIFFAVCYYGFGVASSVASEKSSRVMETLVVSVKPGRLLLGKCFAMGLLGLFQLTLILSSMLLSLRIFLPDGHTYLGLDLSELTFGADTVIFALLYFIFGYFLYAIINSVCGATVSRPEDVNNALVPSMLISLVSFYSGYLAVMLQNDMWLRIFSLIPLTAPFSMPFRLINEAVPMSDIVLSLCLLALSGILTAALSMKVYTASVLYYNQNLRFRDFIRLK